MKRGYIMSNIEQLLMDKKMKRTKARVLILKTLAKGLPLSAGEVFEAVRVKDTPHIYSRRSSHLHSSLQFSCFLPLAIFSQIRYSNYIARYMIHEINEARIYYEQYRTTPDG